MYIIKKIANADGCRPPIQTWNRETPPNGYAVCPEEFHAIFYSTSPAGFVNITVEDDVVTAMEVNQETLDAYIASLPEPEPVPEPEPTVEERVEVLEENMAAVNALLDGEE